MWKMVIEPRTDRKCKLWWCFIWRDMQFFVVVPPRNDEQRKIDKDILVALHLLSSHCIILNLYWIFISKQDRFLFHDDYISFHKVYQLVAEYSFLLYCTTYLPLIMS